MISIYHLAPCVAKVVYQTRCLWGGNEGEERCGQDRQVVQRQDEVRKRFSGEYICIHIDGYIYLPLYLLTTAGQPGKVSVCVARCSTVRTAQSVSQSLSQPASQPVSQLTVLSVATRAACKGWTGVLREQQL